MKFLNSHLLNNNKSIIGEGFEKISVPMTTFKIKRIAAVLTQKGVGTVLCPKCKQKIHSFSLISCIGGLTDGSAIKF
jgi:hypothetical protein